MVDPFRTVRYESHSIWALMNTPPFLRPLNARSRRSHLPWQMLRLIRPFHLTTAMADILAGYGIAGSDDLSALFWLLAATVGLYGGGVVLYDFFNMDRDRVERPERPIPRGWVSPYRAALLGTFLLIIGVAAGFQVNETAGLLSLSLDRSLCTAL